MYSNCQFHGWSGPIIRVVSFGLFIYITVVFLPLVQTNHHFSGENGFLWECLSPGSSWSGSPSFGMSSASSEGQQDSLLLVKLQLLLNITYNIITFQFFTSLTFPENYKLQICFYFSAASSDRTSNISPEAEHSVSKTENFRILEDLCIQHPLLCFRCFFFKIYWTATTPSPCLG